tara:strand:- start:99 stop:389 length:291 start_codon:yes stop_codon:yes gene_type:complete
MEFIKENKSVFFLLGAAVLAVGLWAFGSNTSSENADDGVTEALAELVEESKEHTPQEIVVEATKVESLVDKANEAAAVNQANEAVKNTIDADHPQR